MYIFTIPREKFDERAPDKRIIRQLISKHISLVGDLKKNMAYYQGKHKILEDAKRENRLVCNHAKDISDTASSYFIGNPVTYKSDADIKDLTDSLETAGADETDGDNGLDLSIYGLAYEYVYVKENENNLLTKNLSPARSLRWMRLDNAAKIYPAAKRRNWNNFFRLSATLTEPVDTEVLRRALDVTVRRFPSIAVRLRRGAFWYYLEEIPKAPAIQAEKSCPLAHAPFYEVRQCAFRVLVYHERIAVEFFHALTDGTGALVFLKSLLAEYLSQKYGLVIPAEKGVLGRLEEPSAEEVEDSFARYAGDVKLSRREATAYHLSGTPEPDGYKDIVTMMIPADKLRDCARGFGISVTELLCAAMMQAILDIQAKDVPRRAARKPVKVLLPVNLRTLFPSATLRNFASYITPEIDPRMGDCSFDELCQLVHHKMGMENNRRTMRAKFAANVASERSPVLRVMPLFIKNIAMKAVFDAVGECKSCLCLSNLGRVELPEVMTPYVTRMDFIIGVQARAPHNCGVITWNGTAYINCIRNIREPALELAFYRVLHRLGLPVKVESNTR